MTIRTLNYCIRLRIELTHQFFKMLNRRKMKTRIRFWPTSLPLRMNLVAVDGVAAVQCTQVTLYRQLPVHHRILGHQIRLVEVVRMLHVCSSKTCNTHTISSEQHTRLFFIYSNLILKLLSCQHYYFTDLFQTPEEHLDQPAWPLHRRHPWAVHFLWRRLRCRLPPPTHSDLQWGKNKNRSRIQSVEGSRALRFTPLHINKKI